MNKELDCVPWFDINNTKSFFLQNHEVKKIYSHSDDKK